MKKFKEFIKEKSDSIICFSAFMGMVVMLVWLNHSGCYIGDDPISTQPTKTETTTAMVEENTKINVELPAPTYAKPTGDVSVNQVGFAETIEQLPMDYEIGVCAWADIVLDESEMNLLRTTVYCEAGNQDIDTQVMVALTVLNRLNNGYANDIRGVIYQKGAYAVTKWSNFENRGWTEQVAKAVNIAMGKNEHPLDMYYFRTDYFHGFADDYMKSGDLYFSTQKGD